ncbi:formin-like protein, partial [Haematococcus lacustris]
MSAELDKLDRLFFAASELQRSAKSSYDSLLAFYGENAHSTPSDTEFWAALTLFVEKFAVAQKALLLERKEKAEREARRMQREQAQAGRALQVRSEPPNTVDKDARARMLAQPTWDMGRGAEPHQPTDAMPPQAIEGVDITSRLQDDTISHGGLGSPVVVLPSR